MTPQHVSNARARRLFLTGALVVGIVSACYTGPEIDQGYYGGRELGEGGVAASGCTPDIATIQKTVFLPRCATSGCHAGASPGGSLDLEGAGVEARLIGAIASECGGQTLVKPGDPDNSYLIDKLASKTPACGEAMPSSADALAADDVACIRAWVTGLGTSAGDSGTDAPTSATCEPGLTECGSGCTDIKVDPKNCGKCGNACAAFCANSACVTTCPVPTTNCGGACVDTTTSAANCGACGNKCAGGKICTASACTCGPAVSFAAQLQPILSADCATTGCHTGAQAKANLLLTAGNAFAELVNAPSAACNGKTLVVPGAADQSYLVNKLTGVGMCAGSVMPKAGGQLSPAQIDLFRGWICNGAPNN